LFAVRRRLGAETEKKESVKVREKWSVVDMAKTRERDEKKS